MTSPFIDHLGHAIVPIVVLAAFALFRKYLPAQLSTTDPNSLSREDLDLKFQNTKWIVATCMVVVGILFALITHAFLAQINAELANRYGPADFRFLPQTAIWWIFPGLGAVALSWEITLRVWALIGSRAEVDQYIFWTNSNPRYGGMDSTKVLRWLSVVIVLPVGVLTVLDLNSHDIVGPTEIRACGYAFATCKVYPYNEARRMTTIEGFRDRDGKFSSRAGIVLDFSDGRRWSSAGLSNFEKSVDPNFAVFLSRKTGLPMNFAESEADIPPLAPTP
jgi:hypothetical protein